MARQRRSKSHNHRTRNLIALVVFIIVAIAALGYMGLRTNEQGASVKLTVGDKAPQFILAAVNGSSFDLGRYQGSSHVLLFFNEGLSCSPCLQQMVDIDKNYSTFSEMGITVVSITTNSMQDLKTWAQNKGITKIMVLPDPTLKVDEKYDTLYAGSMHSGSAPGHTFILVGKDGNVLWRKDYGSYTMYVPMNELIASIKSALR